MKKMRSVEASRRAWAAPVKGSDQLLTQALSRFADEDFECYPSIATLASMINKTPRHTTRLLNGLRDRGVIGILYNKGGQKKCNRYRLLFAFDAAGNHDTNHDIPNHDMNANHDISASRTMTKSTATMTKGPANHDIAMSDEGLKEFRRVKEEWLGQMQMPNHDTHAFTVRKTFEAFDEIDPATVLGKIQNGSRVTRNAVCEIHGQFVLAGWLFDNWIAWAGREQTYGRGWTGDQGSCHGCYQEFQAHIAEKPEFKGSWPRLFALETPAMCPTHGPLILRAGVRVYADVPVQYIGYGLDKINIDEEWMGHCPECQALTMEEIYVCDALGLSGDEWTLRGEQVMAALHA